MGTRIVIGPFTRVGLLSKRRLQILIVIMSSGVER